ncbi:unnamed protein product [Rotaria sp. Silwood1]|nr:unnamed protein product [Rotaria sp. Silwood1]
MYLIYRYGEAIECYQEALICLEKDDPLVYTTMISVLEKMGFIFNIQHQYDEALNAQRRALQIRNENKPIDHLMIAKNLKEIEIGLAGNSKTDYDRAAEYFEKCLHIIEASVSLADPMISDIILYLSLVEEKRNHRELSLAHEINYCLICLKFRPLDQRPIGYSFSRIGQHYEHLNKPILAIDYYRQALTIFQNCLPEWHESRIDMELKLERLSKETIM